MLEAARRENAQALPRDLSVRKLTRVKSIRCPLSFFRCCMSKQSGTIRWSFRGERTEAEIARDSFRQSRQI